MQGCADSARDGRVTMATLAEPQASSTLDDFRAEVRSFLEANFPPSLKGKGNALASVEGPTRETPEMTAWRVAMGERGWGTPTWPKEYGGGGLSKAEARVLADEMARVGAWNPIGG